VREGRKRKGCLQGLAWQEVSPYKTIISPFHDEYLSFAVSNNQDYHCLLKTMVNIRDAHRTAFSFGCEDILLDDEGLHFAQESTDDVRR